MLATMTIFRSPFRLLFVALPLSALLLSCGNLGYYTQCATGHLGVMTRCRPIPKILADPGTSPELAQRLETVMAIREFASSELGLPRNGSYTSYADLGRPFVVWNVVATPEFSLKPLEWCFPVAGCVPYRGYFSREGAERFARELREKGHDVHLYGVPAYSTLNWFDDPVLNTFCDDRPTYYIAGLIFHELAHQVLYIPGDSRFNEAFAETVEIEGGRRWLERFGSPEDLSAFLEGFEREERFTDLLLRHRTRLADLYGRSLPPEQMRSEKGLLFDDFRQALVALKEAEGGFRGFDSWIMMSANNARLASVSTYRDLRPAFRELLLLQGGDLGAFYRAARELGGAKPEERESRLAELAGNRPSRAPLVDAGALGLVQAKERP